MRKPIKIDINDAETDLVLNNVSLKGHRILQLFSWGGSEINALNLKFHYSDEKLIKIIKYLEKEEVAFKLGVNAKNKLIEINANFKEITDLRKIASLIKKGERRKGQFEELEKFLTNNIPRKLKDHQIQSSIHLYTIKNGANFSVPGSGKTSVVLSVYEKLRSEGRVNTIFVVGPPSCFGPWKNEFSKTLGRDPKFQILAGGKPELRKLEYYKVAQQNSELYLTTFNTLLRDQQDVIQFLSQNKTNVFLVVDEAHYFKQIEGNWAKAVINLAKHAKYRCVLTGTPLPKSYSDVFNLFDFLWPDNNPIDSKTKHKLIQFQKNNDEVSAKELLKQAIDPLFFRVTKSQLGLKEPKYHKPIRIGMNPIESLIYRSIVTKIRDFDKEDYLKEIGLVEKLRRARIIRLRQCTSYVKLLSNAITDYNENLVDNDSHLLKLIKQYDDKETPAKVEYLLSLIKEILSKNEKVIVWSTFVGTLKLIRSHLLKNKIRSKIIYGETPIEQTSTAEEETREKIRDEFVDPKSGLDVLIANPAACAESISLHKTCHNAIYYDLSYNCAQFLQSLDRIHRVGGSENITAHYFFLQYKDTIDEDIQNNLKNKAKRMYEIIEEDNNVFSLNMFDETDDELEAYGRIIR